MNYNPVTIFAVILTILAICLLVRDMIKRNRIGGINMVDMKDFIVENGVFAKLNDGSTIYAKDSYGLESQFVSFIDNKCREILKRWDEEGTIILTSDFSQVNFENLHKAKYFKFASVPTRTDLEIINDKMGYNKISILYNFPTHKWLKLDVVSNNTSFINYEKIVSDYKSVFTKILLAEATIVKSKLMEE